LSYAYLRYADLRSANLSYANLSYADLRSANLRSADLRSADLRSADLSYADLRSADLSSADLSSIHINNAVGNGSEIKSLHIESEFSITYNTDSIAFGCTQLSFGDWLEMKDHESDFWKKYRDIILKIVEVSPATPYVKKEDKTND
jgi:uncharacterized protein YjbI with pentapeptide repeats